MNSLRVASGRFRGYQRGMQYNDGQQQIGSDADLVAGPGIMAFQEKAPEVSCIQQAP
jgi:hypothetical protein